jgi:hypothetical protein
MRQSSEHEQGGPSGPGPSYRGGGGVLAGRDRRNCRRPSTRHRERRSELRWQQLRARQRDPRQLGSGPTSAAPAGKTASGRAGASKTKATAKATAAVSTAAASDSAPTSPSLTADPDSPGIESWLERDLIRTIRRVIKIADCDRIRSLTLFGK